MNKNLYRPAILAPHEEIVAALSLRDEAHSGGLSVLSTNHTEDDAIATRAEITKTLGFAGDKLAIAWLQHADDIAVVDADFKFDSWLKVDALVSNTRGWLLGVTVADCVGVLLYDPTTKAIAAIHSGWRGSLKNITGKTVTELTTKFGVNPADLRVYVGPAPHLEEYETDSEIAEQFNAKYSRPSRAGHAWFDNQAVVIDQLTASGIPKSQMEIDSRSTISDPQLHSYRRDSDSSGRMIVAIGLREDKNG